MVTAGPHCLRITSLGKQALLEPQDHTTKISQEPQKCDVKRIKKPAFFAHLVFHMVLYHSRIISSRI